MHNVRGVMSSVSGYTTTGRSFRDARSLLQLLGLFSAESVQPSGFELYENWFWQRFHETNVEGDDPLFEIRDRKAHSESF